MPRSRAIARSDNPAAPSGTRCRRPSSMIWPSMRSREPCRLPMCHSVAQTRSVLLNFPAARAILKESTALEYERDIMTVHYDEPNLAARTFNELFRLLAEAGISIAGTRALRVRGRKTGKLRGVVINLLTVEGHDYVVSPRGDTQWA